MLLDCKEIKPLNPKGNQSWIFIGRTDAEAPILWSPDVKNWLTGKDRDAGKDIRQEDKGMTGWDGCMASLTLRTWIWVNSGSWWWTVKLGMLQSMWSQRVRHNWVTELNWTRSVRMWSTGEGNGKPLQYSCLENPMNHSMPGLPVHHQLLESTQTHVH